jgi:uncharacterized protein DUF3307
MINIYTALFILFVHWFADFICQTSYLAQNKSKSSSVLFQHVLIYSIVMAVGVAIITIGVLPVFYFFLITFVCHFATDFVTSRITGYFYKKEEWHWFFVVIGFDQFLHAVQLFITYTYLFL